jgi:hypothetical protein
VARGRSTRHYRRQAFLEQSAPIKVQDQNVHAHCHSSFSPIFARGNGRRMTRRNLATWQPGNLATWQPSSLATCQWIGKLKSKPHPGSTGRPLAEPRVYPVARASLAFHDAGRKYSWGANPVNSRSMQLLIHRELRILPKGRIFILSLSNAASRRTNASHRH